LEKKNPPLVFVTKVDLTLFTTMIPALKQDNRFRFGQLSDPNTSLDAQRDPGCRVEVQSFGAERLQIARADDVVWVIETIHADNIWHRFTLGEINH